ncbi:MAG: nuclear transport factor 2 family protein [Pseudomonadota bacterium]
MIRPSPEICAVARRFVWAVQNKDGAALRNLVSASENTSFLGTAADELWTGARVRDGLGAHFAEAPDMHMEEIYTEAYECGDLGWAFHEYKFRIGGREDALRFRATLVFALEDGTWRVIHRHASLPVDNAALHDQRHTILDSLMEAAQADLPWAGKTGLASVMFTDICGSTSLAEVVGDVRWAEIAQSHTGAIQSEVESCGGTLVKSLGDGTLSVFSSARQALRAATAIQRALLSQTEEPMLRVRIGLHTGEIVETGDDFMGTVVNKAARIAASAGPGEIRVTDATRAMIGGLDEFQFSPGAEIPLAGLSGRHLFHTLDWRSSEPKE